MRIQRFLAFLFAGYLIFMGILALMLFLTSRGFFEKPDFSKINDAREMSVIFDETEERIKEYCAFCREITTLHELGEFPKLAVAAEDRNFWKRATPFDWRGIIRAFWQNFKTLRIAQGASTISQQLSRNLFAEEELKKEREGGAAAQKIYRKIKEAWLATQLEYNAPREKILEVYLNTVYCGSGRYGALACSRFYFDKEPAALTVAESAMLIGLWRSPDSSPFSKKNAATLLRNRVLGQFAEENIITEEQQKEFSAFPLPEKRERDSCKAEHAAEYIRKQMVRNGRFVDQGIRVRATLNCQWQRVTTDALRVSLDAMRTRNPELTDLRGVAILLDTHTGAIKVFAQEPAFQENEYLIDQVKRHLGSAAKPFFYTAWLEKGGRLSCNDEGTGPCKLDDSYGNAEGKSALTISLGTGRGAHHLQNFPYEGLPRYIGMAEPIICIAESRNVCTMSGVIGIRNSRAPRLIAKEEILELMMRLGITLPTQDPEIAKRNNITLLKSKLAAKLGIPENTVDPGLTVAIGSIDVSPLDMASAFSAILEGAHTPYMIEDISDREENLIFLAEPGEAKKTIDEKVSLQMIRGLRATVAFPHGTGKQAKKELDFPVMGKTGTATNQAGDTTDNWFIGCTPSFCMAVWIGREQKLPMTSYDANGKEIQETGGKNALPVFIKTMKAMYEAMPKEQFPEMTDPTQPFRPSEKKETEQKTENAEEGLEQNEGY